jgi:hypothetical protein
MPAELLTFSFWVHVIFCAIGASVLYSQWGRSELRAYTLSAYLDTISFKDEASRARVEMIIFLIMGTLLAMGLAHPRSVPQAFAAGAGFTGLTTKPTSASSKKKTASKPKREV